MATLGRIRNRSGLLLAVIGVAMLAFILVILCINKIRWRWQYLCREVLGEDVMRQAYEVKVEEGIKIGNIKIHRVYLIKQLQLKLDLKFGINMLES